MKYYYSLIIFIGSFVFPGAAAFAQLIGDNAFLQGHWLEVGVAPNGSWGNSLAAPAGYHSRGGSSPYYVDPITGTSPSGTGANGLDFSFDQGHDGWGVGAIPFYGSYFLPGTPFDGWQIQLDDTMGSAFYNNGGGFGTGAFDTTLGGVFGGTVTKYTGPSCWNPHAPMAGTWEGTYGVKRAGLRHALQIVQVNEVDTNSSWLNVTTKFYNTTDSTLKGVYYMATADPDNDVPVGGSFPTNNHVAYQGSGNRHEVWARPPSIHQDCFSGLATQDCRSQALIYQAWPPFMTTGNDLDKVYAGTATSMGTCYYALGATTLNQDIAYGLVFNVGNIAPHDSAYITFAWIFSDTASVDSLFELVPQLSTLGNQYTPLQPDTVIACNMMGCGVVGDTFNADIINGENRDWGLSTWTWSPGIALSSSVGQHVKVYVDSLPSAITYTITGTQNPGGSCRTPITMSFTLYVQPCFTALNNSPCDGATLWFGKTGDSVGATYLWKGPHGFTSTLHDAYIYPVSYFDTGWYYVYRTLAGITDTDSTHVNIHPRPTLIVSDNSPLCSTMVDTLKLSAVPYTPGETFTWTGPAAFASTLEFPRLPGFGGINTGTYTVVATTVFGCSDTGTVFADTIPPPLPPIITDRDYCQDTTATPVSFVPFTVIAAGTVLWYTGPVGGVGSTTPPTINTTIPGIYNVWATQTVGSCESPRGTDQVHVTRTPPKPLAAGGTDYCQHIGPFKPLFITLASASAQALWYTTPTGGVPTFTEPTVDINTAGTYNYWVSQTDSGCEGPRLMVVINVHAKPGTPVVTPQWYCQFWPGVKVIATASGSGDVLRWHLSPGDTIGNAVAPVPSTSIPGLDTFYVNETSTFGCIGDRVIDTVRIRPKPAAPHTLDTTYCQFAPAVILTADSLDNSHLNWYISGVHLPTAPTPPNNVVGPTTWYVSQTINGCESDSTAIKVTTIYQPNFYITPQRPYSCQFDSMWLAYTGPALDFPAYIWSIPKGTAFVSNMNTETGRSLATDSMIYVRFDSASQDIYFHLHASDDHGMCFFDTSIRIRVIPHPTAVSYSKSDVCAGDTVSLALSSRSADASIFTWAIDNVPMETSTALNIITHNTNTGGPFGISWNDSGRHVITVQASTPEGCTNPPTPDTVFVHKQPDASFQFTTKTGVPLCLEDSVQFIATASENYNYGFAWSPEHFFQNINKGVTWGKVEQSRSIITLQVTDPFGCIATTSQEIDPSSCCTVSFPNAFTPNMDGKNDLFRPIFVGYHRFHIFRIANRWGQTVYESSNSKMAWDGTFNGVPQEMGVYFYYLQFDCGGNTIEQSGDVTLIR